MKKIDKLITIAICTYNRNKLLEELLKHLGDQTAKESLFDIYVIDNFSDKAKMNYLKNKFKKVNNINFFHSSPPGLSMARNYAIKKCKTRYIAFVDDDALPSNNWIKELLSTFSKYKAHCVGGPIIPVWPHGRPEWMPNKYEDCLTILDHGDTIKRLDQWQYLYGTNIAFQTSVIKDLGGFDSALGRKGSISLLSDEEVDLQKTMDNKKFLRYYNPNASVKHVVHLERLRQTYLRSRMAWQAVSDISKEVDPEQVFWELVNLCNKSNIDILNLFDMKDKYQLTVNIDILIVLQKFILAQHLLTDEKMNDLIRSYIWTYNVNGNNLSTDTLDKPFNINDYANIEYLFIDSIYSHSFLYNSLSWGLDSRFFEIPYNTWNQSFSEFEIVSILSNSKKPINVFFITLDSLIWGVSTSQTSKIIERFPQHNFAGIVHRSFDWIDSKIVKNTLNSLTKVFVLNDYEKNRLKKKYGIETEFLDVPASYSNVMDKFSKKHVNNLRKARKLKENVFIFSGQLRSGKGINLFLNALNNLDNNEIKKMSVIFSGSYFEDIDLPEVEKKLKKSKIHYEFKFSSNVNPDENRLDDFNLALDLFISDFSFLLYQKDQLNIGSATLSNSVNANCKIIATKNSFAGKQVKENDLGDVISNDKDLTKLLKNIINSKTNIVTYSKNYKQFKEKIMPQIIAKNIKNQFN